MDLEQLNAAERALVRLSTDDGKNGHLNKFFKDLDSINNVCSRRDVPNRFENCLLRDGVFNTFASFLGLKNIFYYQEHQGIDTFCVTPLDTRNNRPGWEVLPFMDVLNKCLSHYSASERLNKTKWITGTHEEIKESLRGSVLKNISETFVGFSNGGNEWTLMLHEHYKNCAVYKIFESMCDNLIDNVWFQFLEPTEKLFYIKFVRSYHSLTRKKYADFTKQSIKLFSDVNDKKPYAMILIAAIKSPGYYHKVMENYETEYKKYCTKYSEMKIKDDKIALEVKIKKMVGLGDGVNDDDGDDDDDPNTMMAINFDINSEDELEILLMMVMAKFFNQKLFNNVFSYMHDVNANHRLKYGIENHMLKTVNMPEMRLLPPSMLKRRPKTNTLKKENGIAESKLSGPKMLVPLVNKRVLRLSKDAGPAFYSLPGSDPSVLAGRPHKQPSSDAGGGRRSRRVVRRIYRRRMSYKTKYNCTKNK